MVGRGSFYRFGHLRLIRRKVYVFLGRTLHIDYFKLIEILYIVSYFMIKWVSSFP
jgi:hypothetical protein